VISVVDAKINSKGEKSVIILINNEADTVPSGKLYITNLSVTFLLASSISYKYDGWIIFIALPGWLNKHFISIETYHKSQNQ
jgi:hypothetical protein